MDFFFNFKYFCQNSLKNMIIQKNCSLPRAFFIICPKMRLGLWNKASDQLIFQNRVFEIISQTFSYLMAGIFGNMSIRHSLLKSVALKSNSCKLSHFSHSAAITCSFCREVCCNIKHLKFLHLCNKIFRDVPVTLAQ